MMPLEHKLTFELYYAALLLGFLTHVSLVVAVCVLAYHLYTYLAGVHSVGDRFWESALVYFTSGLTLVFVQ